MINSSALAKPPIPDAFSARRVTALIDARKILDGGIGIYIQNLVRGLLALGETRVWLLGDPDSISDFNWSNEVKVIPCRVSSYSAKELFAIGRLVSSTGADLFHEPHFTLPFRVSIPSIVTIHDLIHITHPEKWHYPIAAKLLVGSALSRASSVLTVSRASATELARRFPECTSKLSVIPNVIDEELSSSLSPSHNDPSSRFDGPYFLCVLSNLKPHKGFEDLLSAFSKFKASPSGMLSKVKLVLAGQGSADIAASATRHPNRFKDTITLGTVTKSELRDLYKGSKGVIVPSLAEGFCLPALEARSAGARIICRPVPAIQELITDYDIMARDFSVDALYAAISQAAVSRELVRPANDRWFLERYSSSQAAANLSRLYRSLVAHPMEGA